MQSYVRMRTYCGSIWQICGCKLKVAGPDNMVQCTDHVVKYTIKHNRMQKSVLRVMEAAPVSGRRHVCFRP